MNIYILQGSTGEYSDRTDWIVRAYTSKDEAEADCFKANDEAHAVMKTTESYWEITDKEISLLTVDPNAQFDYTGTSYWVKDCELKTGNADILKRRTL